MSKCNLGACVAAVAIVSSSILGCGGAGGSAGQKTYQVSGVVTQGGNPVDGATVTFVLTDGSKSASGRTDKDGRYTLSTTRPGDGAVPGEYKVSVVKFEAAAATGSTSEKDYVQPKEGETAPAPKNVLPEKYAKAETSGLTATVKESGDNKLDFTLD